jgi:nucleoside 2-deoxyribosyltransferase
MIVYLSGPINGCNDEQAKGWRSRAVQLLPGCETLDPMREDFRGREHGNLKTIVTKDKKDIQECDVLLVNAERPSWGTAMEIMYGHIHGKRVVGFRADTSPSPWLDWHCELRRTIEDACEAILKGKK